MRQKSGQSTEPAEKVIKEIRRGDRVHCMDRCRGGLTTKFHALVDFRYLLVQRLLTSGLAHDLDSAKMLLVGFSENDFLLTNKAYDADKLHHEVTTMKV